MSYTPTEAKEINPPEVEQFLIENPTFFNKREHILADMYLPYGGGSAISLQERQVSILRERNIDMRKRLNEFLEQGQRNDVLFQKTTTLVLNLLEAKNLTDLIQRLVKYCEDEFQVDKVQFTLFTSSAFRSSECRVVSILEVERALPFLIRDQKSVSGLFREDEFAFLFANQAEDTASAIVLPIINKGKMVAMLALGSNDAHYFKAGMNTLFLGFIGDVISKLLPRTT